MAKSITGRLKYRPFGGPPLHGAWYTSTNATPLAAFTPETMAVYAPGGSVRRSTESELPDGRGNEPTAVISVAIAEAFALVDHTVLDAITVPDEFTTLNEGCAKAPATPNWLSVGPMARINTFPDCDPLTTKPPISKLVPEPTKALVEILMSSGSPLFTSYTSASATPVLPFSPTICAV